MRKKTLAKRQTFIHAAGDLFLERGFFGVTMEAIALKANASKMTLYNYFSSKDDIFKAYIVEVGVGSDMSLLSSLEFKPDVRAVLYHLGIAYLAFVTSPDVVSLERLVIGEAGRSPELAHVFYENGPKKILVIMSQVIQELMDEGLLCHCYITDCVLDFQALCSSGVAEKCLWNIESPPELDVQKEKVKRAISIFTQHYSPTA
ncbi:TetR/AcrR family transcriptional regulator [Celerinatantimonas yamalensis]|uniref:TetR/AcrR family transcriptional regulator n=1 Tax=Celerinatantimonas yamalensis TaxID=559956 RepID=A0ABW9G8G8_9GAMM